MQDFDKKIRLAFSTTSDGSMAVGAGQPLAEQQIKNADQFLQSHGFPLKRSRVAVKYDDSQTYVKVERVTPENADQAIQVDALYTTEKNCPITLPVADCVATVVFDPATVMLGVLHLGRHSSVAGLIEHFVVEVADILGSDPRDWKVWMSPSLRQAHDQLEYFDAADSDEWRDFVRQSGDSFYIDVVGHNKSRFIRAGVDEKNIMISPEETYGNPNYFSHREAQTKPDRQGRMMLAAMLA